jgi:hypothetical protein
VEKHDVGTGVALMVKQVVLGKTQIGWTFGSAGKVGLIEAG